MMPPTKVLTHPDAIIATTASAEVVIGTAADISAAYYATLNILQGIAHTTPATIGFSALVQVSSETSGPEWVNLYTMGGDIGTASDEAVSGTCASGQAVIGMASTTGFTVGDFVFIRNSTLANSEWGYVKAVTANTSITLADNLVNAQTGSTVYDLASYRTLEIPALGYNRVRVIYTAPTGPTASVFETELICVTAL
jgi:hypothetical protein